VIFARSNTSRGAPLAKPGKSKREIIRCLKRYVARQVYRVLIPCDPLSLPTSPKEEAQIGAGNNAA
jgi:hypothetical protein